MSRSWSIWGRDRKASIDWHARVINFMKESILTVKRISCFLSSSSSSNVDVTLFSGIEYLTVMISLKRELDEITWESRHQWSSLMPSRVTGVQKLVVEREDDSITTVSMLLKNCSLQPEIEWSSRISVVDEGPSVTSTEGVTKSLTGRIVCEFSKSRRSSNLASVPHTTPPFTETSNKIL